MANKEKTIVVTGDIAIDWNLMADVLKAGDTLVMAYSGFSRICGQEGGVLLLADLLNKIVARINVDQPKKSLNWKLIQRALKESKFHPDDENLSHSIVSWAKYAEDKKTKAKTVWRVKEFLGVEKAVSSSNDIITDLPVLKDNLSVDIIVLDDANLGFRDDPALWPQAINKPDKAKKPIVILKTSEPVAQGELWKHLHANFAENLIVIVSVDNLRKAEVQISRELSWERTAQDTAKELVYNPAINSMMDCRNVVVTFKNAGAILFSNKNKGKNKNGISEMPKCELFFDPKVVEGMWEQEYEGGMLGYHTCMTAAVARQFLLEAPELDKGIKDGLSAMRLLHKKGYQETDSCKGHKSISFPAVLICDDLFEKDKKGFSKTNVYYPKPSNICQKSALDSCKKDEVWTILREQYHSQIDMTAYNIVKNGAEETLKDLPLGKFGKMLTVDRLEIEGFRSIRTLINEYCAQKHAAKPLSIAVFGPPGSGKSFGVKQIAKSLSYNIEEITFNLSQMKSSDELIGAFHQIRDKVLKGLIPLVFWDEFDSKLDNAELGWLRFFLSPMQDGEFLEGQLSHPIGKAIFVFAGGTCTSIKEFNKDNDKDENIVKHFKDSKGPDFVSRLRGYVDITGVNPPKQGEIYDPYFIIKRAILLRSVLEYTAPDSIFTTGSMKTLKIDRGVLHAFLLVKEYYHGVRSMEAIINMSMLTGRDRFERSSLPSAEQLNIHVDGKKFLCLANSIVLEGEILENLAAIAHDMFCEGRKKQGYIYAPERNNIPPNLTSPMLVPYSELSEYYKESNRDIVRDIPAKLACIGCAMTLKSENKTSYKLSSKDIESLAEAEHDRFMRQAVKSGWHYEEGKKVFPVDPTLLPWKKMTKKELEKRYPDIAKAMGLKVLPELEKVKDRDIVENIPVLLDREGYIVERLD